MREGLECRVLRTTGELEEFAPQWRALWSADEEATPFQSPEWLLPWWNQFGQEDLRAVVLSRGGRTIGLLPFYVYREPRNGERQLLLMGVGTTDYLDGVFAPECSAEDIVAGVSELRAEGGWDVMTATQLRLESKLYRALAPIPGIRAFESEGCSRMPAGSIDDLQVKLRRHVKYYGNRARRDGELELVVAGEGQMEETFAALQRLHTERWQERGENGVLADERVLRWHGEALPMLAASGMLRLCSLRMNGDVVAAMYSVADPVWRSERTEYVYLMAYSTRHQDMRPGTLLLAMETERAAAEGVGIIDMLRGEEMYKQAIWHTERVATYGFALGFALGQSASAADEDMAIAAAA